MNTTSWVLTGVLIVAFLFVLGPIAMHMWGTMFAKGFFSSISKHFNKNKTDEHKENK